MSLPNSAIIFVFLFIASSFPSYAEKIIYHYDDLNRLIRVEPPDGSFVEYVYDDVGNRTKKEVAPRTSCPGDIKGDGDIDGADLALILEDLETACSGECQGDLDGNGVVDVADVVLFTEYFGRSNCQ